jgi:predicted bacteriocin transport accessory protein
MLLISIIIVSFFAYRTYKQPNYLVTISQENIESNINKKNNFIVYVGRDSCPSCKAFKPKLIKYLSARQKKIFYFNTQGTNEAIHEFRKFYNSLGVRYVPSIIIIQNGKVTHILSEKNLNQLDKYF